MKRLFRWTAIVVVILVLAVLALPLFIDANRFRPELEARLTAALERKVTIGDLSVALLSGGVAVRDVTIAGDPGSLEPMLRAKSISAGVAMGELIFSQRLLVHTINIDEPVIVLVDSPGHAPRPTAPATQAAAPAASTQPAASVPLNLSIERIRISNGRISATTTSGAKPLQLDKVNLDLRNLSANSSFPITLSFHLVGGGDIELEGQAGPVQPSALADTPFDAKLKITGLDLAASGFFAPETGIAGLLTLNGKATADGHRIETDGVISLKDLKLAKGGKPATRPAEMDFNIAHENASRRGKIQGSKVKLGSAQATLGGTYDLSGREPSINMKLAGENMALTELAAFLPALDVQLPAGSNIEGGTANVDITAQGPISALTTAASVRADKARLAKFDLGAKLKILEQIAGIPTKSGTDIELMTSDVRSTPEGTVVNGLKLVVPGIGELTGQGTISPQHALDFKMLATLATSGTVKAMLGQNVPFVIQGTSADPSFKADLKGVAGQKLQQAIKNPDGAAKTVNGIINMFKRSPKTDDK